MPPSSICRDLPCLGLLVLWGSTLSSATYCDPMNAVAAGSSFACGLTYGPGIECWGKNHMSDRCCSYKTNFPIACIHIRLLWMSGTCQDHTQVFIFTECRPKLPPPHLRYRCKTHANLRPRRPRSRMCRPRITGDLQRLPFDIGIHQYTYSKCLISY